MGGGAAGAATHPAAGPDDVRHITGAQPRDRVLARQHALMRRHADMAARMHAQRRNGAFVGYREHGARDDLVLTTKHGPIRIRLRADISPATTAQIITLARQSKGLAGEIFRHEPVAEHWGDPSFGPPYALVSGSFNTDDGDWPLEGNPVVLRGDVGMVPGSTTWVICLADHPEWGTSHTVWGRVDSEDAASWAVISKIPMEPYFNRTSDGITTRWLEPSVVVPFWLELWPAAHHEPLQAQQS